MKHTLKKVLALTLCAALGLSLVGGAFAADAPTAAPAETPKPGTFDLGAVCTDDGQYVNSVVIHLEKPADATAEELKDAFAVTVKGFTINFYGFIVKDNEDMPRIIDDVAVSEDGLTVTLTLRYAGEGINFFNGDTLAAKTDFELHNGAYAVEVAKNVGTLTTASRFTYSGKMTDPEENKWGAVDKTATEYNYRYYDPAVDGRKMPEKGYALVVWLHGAGESVQTVDGKPVYDNKLQITANRVTAWGQKETQDMFGGAYVLAPQMDGLKNPSGWGWNPEVVMATIKAFIAKVGPETVDMSRIVIGGCSMGGMGTWETIKTYPDFFSAAFPTCGGTSFTEQDIKNLMHLPIYCIHTVEDGTVPIAGTLGAYDTLTAAGKTNIYLALYEHTWTVGSPDSTPEDLAGLAANGHSSWIYTHNDIDGEKEGDKYFLDSFTYEPTHKTYYNTKPSELGYQSLHDWLAGQVNEDVYFTTKSEVVAFGEIVRSVTVYGLGLKTGDKLPEIVVKVTDATLDAEGTVGEFTRTPVSTVINADGSVTLTFATGHPWIDPDNAAGHKYLVTVDGKEIQNHGDYSDVDDFEPVSYPVPEYTFRDKTYTVMNARSFTPDKTAYPKPEGGYPLIVWLHGVGESGDDNRLPVSANDVHAWTEKPSQDIFGGAYVLAIQNHAAASPEACMSVILQYITGKGDIDMTRIYIGGCSMGGIATWTMLKNYPNFFAAAFPVCGATTLTAEEAASLAHLPIYLIHSVDDPSVNISGSLNAYDDLTKAGSKSIHLALFEHVVFEGGDAVLDGTTTIQSVLGHWSWVYAHDDIDATEECWLDEYTPADSTVTYKTDTPKEAGYATFKTWLAAQKNPTPSVFKDVNGTTENQAAILSLALSGVIKGVTPNAFAPDAPLTRAQFVTLIARAMGAEVDNTKPAGFTDVAANSWETGAVKWAADTGLVQGYGNGKFGPSDPLTQEQANTIIGRYIARYGTVMLQGYAEPDGLATRGSVVPIIANIAVPPSFVILSNPTQVKDLDMRGFRTWGQYLTPEDYVSSSTTYDYTDALTLFEENTFTNPDKNADELTKEIKYFVYDPTEHGADPNGAYPVIYWFHGAGNAVDTGMSATCAGYAGAAMFATEEYQEKMGAAYIVVPLANETKPNGQNAGTWGTRTADGKTSIYSQVLGDLMDAFMKEHKDTTNGKLVMAGTSAGGYMAWRYMLDHTSTISGALLMAPAYTPTDEDLAKIDRANFPVWHVHGIHDELCAYSSIVTPVEEKLNAMDNYDLTPFEWVRHGDHSIATLNVGIEMGQHCICNEVGANLMFDDGTPMAESHPDGVTGWFKTVFEG